MTTRIKLRRDTADNWDTINPVLALGEPGYDTTNNKLKIGDGVTAWQDLSYLTDETGGGGSGDRLTNGEYELILNADGSLTGPTTEIPSHRPFDTIEGPTLKLGDDPTVNSIIITGTTPDEANPNARRIIIQGQKGEFVSYPARKQDDGKYFNYIYCSDVFNRIVLEKAHQAKPVESKP